MIVRLMSRAEKWLHQRKKASAALTSNFNLFKLFHTGIESTRSYTCLRCFDPKFIGNLILRKKVVTNSENPKVVISLLIGFDFTEKALYFTEKHKEQNYTTGLCVLIQNRNYTCNCGRNALFTL